MELNTRYQALAPQYLFSDVARKVARHRTAHPEASIISLGIGDVTQPLAPVVVQALEQAAREMGCADTFHGYGPEQGYPFLRQAILNYYAGRGVSLQLSEVFVSDGAKSDLGNILDLFSSENTVFIPDPVYPVYLDTNRMDGREIRFLRADASNGFLPMPPQRAEADIIYLCSPNNPTGAAYNRAQLQQWVDYALDCGAVILFDAAYERFITQPDIPRSIYEIPGAAQCAIEFCSFSKMAGFTGLRCGWTVVPLQLRASGMSLNEMWLRRQSTKFNGVAYPVQRAAEAALSKEGMQQTGRAIAVYQQNAQLLHEVLVKAGVYHTGGVNSPYLWMRCPDEMDSWQFFHYLLEKGGIVGTPGAGFGENGEGYFRLTAFSSPADTAEAAQRLGKLLGAL